jgi:hypothetical protein
VPLGTPSIRATLGPIAGVGGWIAELRDPGDLDFKNLGPIHTFIAGGGVSVGVLVDVSPLVVGVSTTATHWRRPETAHRVTRFDTTIRLGAVF